MKIIDKSVTEIIDSEYLEYAMYVLESRAIPSAIDGFKPVHRKLVYSMLNIHGGKKTKVVDLSSISSCVPPDTMVYIDDKKITIEEAYDNFKNGIGSKILAYSETDHTQSDAVLLNVTKTPTEKTSIIFELDDNSSIEVSDDHPVLTERGWVLAKDILVDDELIKI